MVRCFGTIVIVRLDHNPRPVLAKDAFAHQAVFSALSDPHSHDAAAVT